MILSYAYKRQSSVCAKVVGKVSWDKDFGVGEDERLNEKVYSLLNDEGVAPAFCINTGLPYLPLRAMIRRDF